MLRIRSISAIVTFVVLFPAYLISQERPPIQNFSTTDYQAQNQNWAISQDSKKIIYAANNEGLLEFNGARWQLYKSPNETIMRSVKVIDDKIFTGCYMEFGYWERNEFGILEYTSISKSLKVELEEDEEFWRILNFNNWILFQSLERIYIYDNVEGTLDVTEASSEIVHMYDVNGSIYYQERNKGLYQIINGQGKLVADQQVLMTDDVVNMFPANNGILLVTRTQGFLTLKDDQLERVNSTELNFSRLNIYSCIKTSSGDYLIGTISNGVIHLSYEGKVIDHYNRTNGLLNNTALSLFEDLEGNFWAGLDNGISLLNSKASIKVFQDAEGTMGSVYTTALFEGTLYLGTNQGLFFKSINDGDKFNFIPSTNGQVWSLRILNGELFCGHHKGTFLVKNGRTTLISNVQGTWDFEPIDKSRIIQGNYDGLYILEKDKGTWKLKNKLTGFDNSSRHFAKSNNNILVNHEYKGVFNLEVNDSYTEVSRVMMDTSLKSPNSSLTRYGDQIFYSYSGGFLKYNQQNFDFILDTTLIDLFSASTFLSGNISLSGRPNEFWLFMRDKITRVSFDNLINQPRITNIPLEFNKRQEVVEFENITHLENNLYLIGTSFGYLTIDLDDLTVKQFNIEIDKIRNGTSRNQTFALNLISKEESRTFKNEENNLSFHFHSASYQSYYQPYYQHQLVGLYNEWSDWSSSSEVFFENLPPGKYEFNVRSKIGNNLSQNIATYKFIISKQWYAANLMIICYILLVIGFSIFMHNVYRRYYKKQQSELVEKSRNEIKLARLQNEKEIMELKNEQLEKENKNKSNELAASTMSIIKKNELLNQIKEQLSKIGDVKLVKPVIKTIDQNLNQRKTWELFQKAFNNADQDFFKKLNEYHPNLSPNDMKLCAYLRLNLSSKEIAGLINISPRSVEVKRYRLRKKLELDNNENLTNYIINM